MKHFTDLGALFVLAGPVGGQALFVEGDDVLVRGLHRFAVGRRQRFEGGLEIGGLEAELAGAEFGAVELRGIISDGFVAAMAHIGEDGGDTVLDFLGRCRAAAEIGEIGLERFGGGSEESHGGWVEDLNRI